MAGTNQTLGQAIGYPGSSPGDNKQESDGFFAKAKRRFVESVAGLRSGEKGKAAPSPSPSAGPQDGEY